MSLCRGWKANPNKMVPKEDLIFYNYVFNGRRMVTESFKPSQESRKQMKQEHTRRTRCYNKQICAIEYAMYYNE